MEQLAERLNTLEAAFERGRCRCGTSAKGRERGLPENLLTPSEGTGRPTAGIEEEEGQREPTAINAAADQADTLQQRSPESLSERAVDGSEQLPRHEASMSTRMPDSATQSHEQPLESRRHDRRWEIVRTVSYWQLPVCYAIDMGRSEDYEAAEAEEESSSQASTDSAIEAYEHLGDCA